MKYRSLASLFIFLSLWIVLISCGSPSELTTEKDSINELPKPSSIPDLPRRTLIKETEWANKKTITVGVNTAFAGSTFAVETEISMNKRYGLAVWLFAPGTTEALTQSPDIFLANSPERPFTFVCRYFAYFDIEPKFRQKLSLFGNGLSNEDAQRDTTGVLQITRNFDVKIGESWPQVFERCQEFANQEKMLESVDHDLQRMVKGLVYHDDQSACVSDQHCSEWHETLLPSVRDSTVPVCSQKKKSEPRFCSIRAAKGSACSLRDPRSGTLLTSGMFEYPCQSGLTCKATETGGWFTGWELYKPWKATCQ